MTDTIATSAPLNVRTPEGRSALDASVLKALKKSKNPAAVKDITATTGASVLQVRAALTRLAAAGKIAKSGNTRATRYTLAAAAAA